MDGTFDQLSPVRRLRGKYTCYSFDLKSATDRWPLGFMFELVRCMFGRSFASSAVNSTLGVNIFFVKKFRRLASLRGSRSDTMRLGHCSRSPITF
jgi:hypothetical protein